LPSPTRDGSTHERRAGPSTCTVHAPHCAAPQPNIPSAGRPRLSPQHPQERRVWIDVDVPCTACRSQRARAPRSSS
jgi:hypothetical protein